MRPDIAEAALKFLSRAQLQAAEIPAFQAVCAEIQIYLTQPAEVADTQDPPQATKNAKSEGAAA